MTGTAVIDTAGKLRAIGDELSELFYEREFTIRALQAAVLAKQHSLLLGPPGTAKSALARELTSRFTGATYWEILLSKFTDPKRMFGPIDVAALTQGVYRQVFEGRATQCEIAFVDEIFKCGAGALNETLAFLNERLYHPENGGEPIACPLIAAITASNELGSGEETTAIYDRLLVRLEVGYLTDPSNFATLIRSAVTPPGPATVTTVDLAELLHAVEVEVPAIEVPDPIVDAICTLRISLRHAELIVSDRRWRAAVRLLQASAYLAGRTQVEVADLDILTCVLWDSPAERPRVEREIAQLVNPDAKEALDWADTIDQLEATLNAKAGQAKDTISTWALKEANPKLNKAGKRLKKLLADSRKAGRSTAVLDRVLAQHRAVQARVMVEALGMDATLVDSTL